MKKQSFMLTVLCGLPLLIMQSCNENAGKNDLLKKVLANIDKIGSASYFATISASAPEDTAKFNTYDWYKKGIY